MKKRVSIITCILMLWVLLSPIAARAATEANDVAYILGMIEEIEMQDMLLAGLESIGEIIIKNKLKDNDVAEDKKIIAENKKTILDSIEATVNSANAMAEACRATTNVVRGFSITNSGAKSAVLVFLNEMTIVYDLKSEKYRHLADAFKKGGIKSTDTSHDGAIGQHLVKAATAYNQAKTLLGKTK